MDEPPKVHQQKSKANNSDEANNGTPSRKTPTLDVSGTSRGSNITRNETEVSKEKSVTISKHPENVTTIIPENGEKKIKYREHTLHRGIIGFMDRELKGTTPGKKGHSFSDPQESPAQHSIRSRSSLEKSPRRKRSKSESRRKRERKLIAAGELEVKQANETLMRYLKQCSEINDVSLSGELEIDHNFDERRVHRKTKSQRDKRGHALSRKSKFYSTNGITSMLRDLPDDIIPTNGEIYNPFTPVVSPTEGAPARISKMFVQTSSGYRTVDHSFYQQPIGESVEECKTQNCVQLSYNLQQIWIKFSNICHGFLGGLALAHLILIATSKPYDWSEGSAVHHPLFADIYGDIFYCLLIFSLVSLFDRMDIRNVDLTNASELISFRWIIITMLYISTIILTLCAETTDNTLLTANYNSTIFQRKMGNKDVWNSLAIARSFGAIVGWFMIGLSPSTDLLSSHLMEMERYYETKN